MLDKIFVESSEDRALAGIINYIVVEIVTRRDTMKSGNDVILTEALIEAHDRLIKAWNEVHEISPIAYAEKWDKSIESFYKIDYNKEIEMVSYYINVFAGMLPDKVFEVFENNSYTAISYQESMMNNLSLI